MALFVPRSTEFLSFEIALRHTTLGGTLLYEGSTRRRNLHVTKHNNVFTLHHTLHCTG